MNREAPFRGCRKTGYAERAVARPRRFDRAEEEAAAVRALTKADVLAFYEVCVQLRRGEGGGVVGCRSSQHLGDATRKGMRPCLGREGAAKGPFPNEALHTRHASELLHASCPHRSMC